MHTLLIKEIINSDIAVSTDDGSKVFATLNKHLLQGDKVILDFQGIIIMTTAFLNAGIGQLYSNKNFKSDFLNQHVNISNVAEDDIVLFRKVIERAKEYFKDKKSIESSANNSFDNG